MTIVDSNSLRTYWDPTVPRTIDDLSKVHRLSDEPYDPIAAALWEKEMRIEADRLSRLEEEERERIRKSYPTPTIEAKILVDGKEIGYIDSNNLLALTDPKYYWITNEKDFPNDSAQARIDYFKKKLNATIIEPNKEAIQTTQGKNSQSTFSFDSLIAQLSYSKNGVKW